MKHSLSQTDQSHIFLAYLAYEQLSKAIHALENGKNLDDIIQNDLRSPVETDT
ncbi:MAG: hypothetical protein KGI71_06420 [Patescibacteria group bacterium]|nr:hypothetical protein [Patescibacteria group bacterium]